MNIKFFNRIVISVMLCLSSFVIFADDKKKNNKPTIITILKSGDILERSVSELPQVYFLNGFIYVTFNSEVGYVTTNVINQSTGTSLQECNYASFTTIVIDINEILTSGEYVIQLICDSNDTYIGYFTL